MSLFLGAKFQAVDDNGVPMAGAKVYFYETGASTTPKDTYTTAACSVANANPVVCDSAGRANIYLKGVYRVVLKDSTDATTVYTIDGVVGHDQSEVATTVTGTSFAVNPFSAIYKTGNSGATTLANITGGYVGQKILVLFNDVYTSVDFFSGNINSGTTEDTIAMSQYDSMAAWYDGTNWNCTRSVSGNLINVKRYIAPGSTTYTPTAGTKSVVVTCVGGGGGSGGTAATDGSHVSISNGGCGGAVGIGRYYTAFSGVTITIGAAGAAGSNAPGAGGAGGASSFGALLSSPGGPGGAAGGTATIPAASTPATVNAAAPSGATILAIPGSFETVGLIMQSGANFVLSRGGPGLFGAVGAYGAGGDGKTAGFNASAAAGGVGFAGVVLVEEYA